MKNFILVVLLAVSFPALSKVNFMEALSISYPSTMGTTINDCKTCHTIDKWQRNEYGMALQDILRANLPGEWDPSVVYEMQEILDAMDEISELDSDNDGFTNAYELESLTFPGDAQDYPIQE